MQLSEESGGEYNVAESVDKRRGILLMRKERRRDIIGARSLREVASAKISKEARIRFTIVDWVSP